MLSAIFHESIKLKRLNERFGRIAHFLPRCFIIWSPLARRCNKSSVTTPMFRNGECTLLSIVPRGDEHYRRSKQCGIVAVHFDQEIRARRILLCAIVFFFSQSFAWSKARSDLCARYPFPGACFGLLEQAKYLFLLKLRKIASQISVFYLISDVHQRDRNHGRLKCRCVFEHKIKCRFSNIEIIQPCRE